MSLSNFYSSPTSSSSSNYRNASSILNGTKTNTSNVCFTLPITCQICLGKVKEPCVCPNLHAFCSFCIEIWLEKTKQCPTCRIPINKENPCKRILGGSETVDDVDLLKPTEFSHSSTRKARFLNMFQQYEDEISRLNKYIDTLSDEVSKLKEVGNGFNCASQNSGTSPQHDMIQMLKTKLQSVQSSLDETCKHRDELKEQNTKLDSENSMLIQDISRLKSCLNEKNSQVTSKYAMAALETKIESYEKEIKQLQKALDKSDRYIADLESKRDHRDKENKQGETFTSNSLNLMPTSTSFHPGYSYYDNKHAKTAGLNTSLKFIKGDNQTFKNELKIVKFSEKVDKYSQPIASPPSSLTLTPKKNVISNDKFYGSPSKTPVQAQPTTSNNTQSVISFTDRMKKNLFNTFDLETQSMVSMNSSNNQNTNMLLSNSSSNLNNNTLNNNQSFLFSPMKRLRLDEVEKSNFNNFNENYLNANNLQKISLSSFDKKSVVKKDENLIDVDNLNGSTSEFIDCIELLNKAEKKVQDRHTSPNKTSSYLPLNNSDLRQYNYLNLGLNPNGSESSASSSGNSLSATITTGASSLALSSDSSSTYNFSSNNSNQSNNNNLTPMTQLGSMKKYPSFDQNLNLHSYQQYEPKSQTSNVYLANTNTFSFLNNHSGLMNSNNYKSNLNDHSGQKEHANNGLANGNLQNMSMISPAACRSRSVEPMHRNVKS